MEVAWFGPDVFEVAVNIAVVTICFSIVGFVIGKIPRLTDLPLRHALLCGVVILTLFSPLPTWLAYRFGFGLITTGAVALSKQTVIDDVLIEGSSGRDNRVIPKSIEPVHFPMEQAQSNLQNHDTVIADNTQFHSSPKRISIQPVDASFHHTWTLRRKRGLFPFFQTVGGVLILLWGMFAFLFLASPISSRAVLRSASSAFADAVLEHQSDGSGARCIQRRWH